MLQNARVIPSEGEDILWEGEGIPTAGEEIPTKGKDGEDM